VIEGGQMLPSANGVGVTRLAFPELMVEIEAMAMK
jgi:enamine deaminase RidA (YjgF/YER057c/UK114 family)